MVRRVIITHELRYSTVLKTRGRSNSRGGGIFGNLISGVKISGDEIPPRSSALTNDIYSSFIYDKITQSYIMHI